MTISIFIIIISIPTFNVFLHDHPGPSWLNATGFCFKSQLSVFRIYPIGLDDDDDGSHNDDDDDDGGSHNDDGDDSDDIIYNIIYHHKLLMTVAIE